MTKHNCGNSEERIVDLLSGEIDAEAGKTMRNEMRGCDECAALLDEMEMVWSAAGETTIAATPSLPGERMREVARSIGGQPWKRFAGLAAFAAAASLAVAVLIGREAPVRIDQPTEPGGSWRVSAGSGTAGIAADTSTPSEPVGIQDRLAAALGNVINGSPEPKTITASRDESVEFPDGSQLLLAEGASVTFRSLDRIEIAGTAFLKAKTRSARDPLYVTANGVEVRITGTEVAFFPEHISVYEGEVRASGEKLAFHTGDRIVVAGKKVRREAIPPSTNEIDWIEPLTAGKRAPLIATDDGEMTIKRQEIRIATEGPVVMTQIHFTFHNPSNRRREGRMSFPLPADASISRLALKIGDRWMEGEFVEKQKARETFETIVRKMLDPALLEQKEGNIFELRIFPFAPMGDREVILSYTQTVSGAEGYRYRLPLPVGETIGEFDLTATLPGARVDTAAANLGARKQVREEIRVEKTAYTPDRDFSMEIPGERSSLAFGDRTVVAKGTPLQPYRNIVTAPQKWLILVDISASMIENTDLLRKTVTELVERLPRNGTARIAFVRETVLEDLGTFQPLSGDRKPLYAHSHRVLSNGPFLGGTNFGVAAGFMAQSGADRVIMVTDGVSTLGNNPPMMTNFNGRIDAVMPSSGGDPLYLEKLTRGHGGVVIKMNRGEEIEQLRHGMLKIVSLPVFLSAHLVDAAGGEIPSYGGELRPVFPGDEFVLAAQAGRTPGNVVFRNTEGTVYGKTGFASTHPVKEEVLARTFALMKIRSLVDRSVDADLARAVREEVIRLSHEARVISPYTSLLALETEEDYRRYGIDRNASAPYLVIENGEIGVKNAAAQRGTPGFEQLRQSSSLEVEGLTGEGIRPGGEPGVPSNATPIYNRVGSVGPAVRERRDASGAGGSTVDPQSGRFPLSSSTNGAMNDRDGWNLNEVNIDMSSKLSNDISGYVDLDFTSPPASIPPIAMKSRTAPRAQEDRVTVPKQAQLGDLPVIGRLFRDGDSIVSVTKDKTTTAGKKSSDIPALEKHVRDNPLDPAARERLVNAYLAAGQNKKAVSAIRAWIPYAPDNVGLYIQLVDLYEASNEMNLARRAAESVVDRLAGSPGARSYLAGKLDEWKRHEEAARQWDEVTELRPELPSAYLARARSLSMAGEYAKAENVLLDLMRRNWDSRFGDINRLGGAELAILYLRWKQSGAAPADIDDRYNLNAQPLGAGMWVILTWETDGTDVDLHVVDPTGEKCYYQNRKLSHGGELLEDLTQGFGPEVFAVEDPLEGEYIIGAHYYAQNVQGVSRGQVTVVLDAGTPDQRIITKPFVLSRQGETVEVLRLRAE